MILKVLLTLACQTRIQITIIKNKNKKIKKLECVPKLLFKRYRKTSKLVKKIK